MKKLLFLSLGSIFLFLGACSYRFDKKDAPDDLIPKDTFTMVLQEVMIVESYFKHQQSNVNDFSRTLPKAINPIFEKYNIDSTRYSNSMTYYSTRQEKFIEVYSQIQDSLTLNTLSRDTISQ
ncbi:DUF4296 domain-containing protein [Brumimicrobium glaciale]|jgi:hypothetical protein|uniref:DUF4296 domain-containing protein n=1 Tax=Brumimicrobium glaciale TaxID=200475 RepID=A0A4V1WFA8_9FLAO|nr:DUF4296 domain-containing protein [Brumimicrobium glaciale]RYM32546.1 DUF4296 domain-containing protein [Brumimicrobium glaciale]